MSVASTRFLIQDQLQIQTSKCDNCIIGFMIILQQIACICSLVACITGNDEIGQLADCINCLSDIVTCSVCSCIQTQHKVELDKRDGKLPGVAPHSNIQMAPPPVQTMNPDPQTYPPQPYPPQPYPPPQQYPPQPYPPPQQYPPQPYPPQAYPPPQQYPPQPYPPQAYPPPQQYPPQAYPPPQQYPPQPYPPQPYPHPQ